MVDQVNCDMEFVTFSGGIEIAVYKKSITGSFPLDPYYFKCSDPFDSLEIRQDDIDYFGWCVDDLCFADFVSGPPTHTPTATVSSGYTRTPTSTPTATVIPANSPLTGTLLFLYLGLTIIQLIRNRSVAD